MNTLKLILCAVALASSTAVFAANALSEFTASARSSYEACRAWDWGASGPAAQRECIATQQALVRPKFEAAQKSLAKNKVASSRLRDFYAFWRAAFEDSVSRDEPKAAYEKRTQDATAAINERAIRLEMEAKP